MTHHTADDPTRLVRPVRACATVIVALVLAGLLNGPALVVAATGLPLGALREAALVVARGTEKVGSAVGLDRPRLWLAAVAGGADLPVVTLAAPTPPADDSSPRTPAAGRPDGDDGHGDDGHGDDGHGDDGHGDDGHGDDGDGRSGDGGTGSGAVDSGPLDEVPPEAVVTAPGRTRPVSVDDPLRVLLIGDSLIGAVADGYGRAVADDAAIVWTKDVQIGTGLARPDVLDWTRHLPARLADVDPDVVVLMMGGNDDQSLLRLEGGAVGLGADGWLPEYRERVADMLDSAGMADRTVIWLELPAVQPSRLETARRVMNRAAREAAEGTDHLVIDLDPIVSPAGFATRVDGVIVRSDGVHLTHAGGDLVAEVLDAAIRERWGLPPDPSSRSSRVG